MASLSTTKLSSRIQAILCALSLFLVLTAYYQLKPLSRALSITHLGSAKLPYIWLASTLVLTILLPFFQWRIRKFSPFIAIAGSSLSFFLLLAYFHYTLSVSAPELSHVLCFYILIDIYSVVLIEQFWSLTNATFRLSEGKKWYGLVGGGALAGGVAGGTIASFVLERFTLKPIDLVYVAMGLLLVLFLLLLLMKQMGMLTGTQRAEKIQETAAAMASEPVSVKKYAVLLTGLILASQLIEPVVEYQFLNFVEVSIRSPSERTQYIASVYALLNTVALLMSFVLTPVIHRYLGVVAGLCAQPLLILGTAVASFSFPSLWSASALKIADRASSYSINRSSKELLYVPFQPSTIYRLKVWVDVYGYRLFRVVGSLFVLLFTQWLPSGLPAADFPLLSILLALAWVWVICEIAPLYRLMLEKRRE